MTTAVEQKATLALSVAQPHALMLAVALKRVETRGWRPSLERLPLGSEFLLHATASPDWEAVEYYESKHSPLGTPLLEHPTIKALPHGYDRLVQGKIIARVELVDIHRYWGENTFRKHESLHLCSLDKFMPTKYGYELKVVEVFSQPVPCRGFQGFFPVPEDVLAELQRGRKMAGATA